MKKLFPLFLVAMFLCWSLAIADVTPSKSSADVSYMPGISTSNITNVGDGELEVNVEVVIGDPIYNNVDPNGSVDIAPYSYGGGNLPVITDYHDSVYCLDLVYLADTHLLGIEFDGTYFWITGGNSGLDPNKLYKLDATGLLVNTYDQSSSAGWGWRDLAWDGTYLWGSDNNFIVQIDPATGLATGVTISGPVSPCRALAYDPATGNFWTASFSSSIWEFNAGGTVNTFANSKAIYGMAWDTLSTDGPWLWVFSQDGTPQMEISQFDPVAGTYTGVGFQGDLPTGFTDGIAGGACFTEWGTDIEALFVLGQGTPDDFVYGYDMFPIGALLGACCVGDQCVATNTQSECDVLQGDWYIGEDCSNFQCPLPGPECPPNSIFDQVPHGPTATWSAATSDSAFQPENYAVFENFNVSGEICDIHWWGMSLEWNAGWFDCVGEAMAFDIIFYPDVGGIPDTANPACVYTNVSPTMTNTGILYAGYPLWRFDLVLNPCCNLASGWVMIQGVSIGNPDCRFLWMSSPTGDGDSYQRASGVLGLTGYDRSLCLTGEYVPIYGACCDDASGNCTDSVEIINCPAPLRFQANTLCADLQPPCVATTGACCVGDDCVATNTQPECDALQGDWYEGEDCATFTCPHDPANCVDAVYSNGEMLDDYGSPASQCAPDYPFAAGAVDDITVSSNTDFQRVVTWTTHWAGNVGGPAQYDGVIITLYLDDVTNPGQPAGEPIDTCDHTEYSPGGIYYTEFVDINNISYMLDTTGCAGDVYRLEIPLADTVTLLASTLYWLEIQPVMPYAAPGGQVAIQLSNTNTGAGAMQIFVLASLPVWTNIAGNSGSCPPAPESTYFDLAFCLLPPSSGGGGCDYVPGDVNGSDSYNGLDITYGVAFFKGGPGPMCPDCPPCNSWNYCGDVNGSCSYNGLDITYGVAYFKGGPGPIPCADCPPNP